MPQLVEHPLSQLREDATAELLSMVEQARLKASTTCIVYADPKMAMLANKLVTQAFWEARLIPNPNPNPNLNRNHKPYPNPSRNPNPNPNRNREAHQIRELTIGAAGQMMIAPAGGFDHLIITPNNKAHA